MYENRHCRCLWICWKKLLDALKSEHHVIGISRHFRESKDENVNIKKDVNSNYDYNYDESKEKKSCILDKESTQRNHLHEWIELENIDWSSLSRNPRAIDLLRDNIENIDWESLCFNPNQDAFLLLEENINVMEELDQGCIDFLSENPGAIHFLEKYQQYINWNYIFKIIFIGCISYFKFI